MEIREEWEERVWKQNALIAKNVLLLSLLFASRQGFVFPHEKIRHKAKYYMMENASDFPRINPLPNAAACLVICLRHFSSFKSARFPSRSLWQRASVKLWSSARRPLAQTRRDPPNQQQQKMNENTKTLPPTNLFLSLSRSHKINLLKQKISSFSHFSRSLSAV